LRTSPLQGLGSCAKVCAIESFIDELAQVAGVDLVGFRLRWLVDERARAVVGAAAEKARSQHKGLGGCLCTPGMSFE
jgi:nicotinate dehydrogenase subunit B